MRILIADDDPVSRRLLERTLERLGHQVVVVEDGLQAQAALLDPAGPPLAILDWEMPGADGLAVCQAVRARPSPYVYVLVLTARTRREDMVAALDAGVDDFLAKPFDEVELRARLRSGERVIDLQAGLLRAQDQLRQQAAHDVLTGLWNRRMVLEQLSLGLSKAERDGTPLAVLVADIDHFKRVNDTHGHGLGDVVLRETAARLRSTLRAHEGIGRYGGEEFLLLLPGCDEPTALQVAERARGAVSAEPIRVGDLAVPVTISVGVSVWGPGLGVAPAALIDAADAALYRAKANGRDRVEVASCTTIPT